MAPGFAWDDVALHLHGIHYPVFDAGGRAARRSFSYHRLPRQLLRLSVLKLDGTSFGTFARFSCLIQSICCDIVVHLELDTLLMSSFLFCFVGWILFNL